MVELTKTALDAAEAIRRHGHHISWTASDFDPLLDLIGDARWVLLGEATHGTHEFYHARAIITRRLIEEKGFCAVAVEADWPDAYRVNRFIRGQGDDKDALEALGDFKRFPTWMWRNRDVLSFVSWLRGYNSRLPRDARVGFYGLDLYSLRASMEAVIEYLDKTDPAAADRARTRYACFDAFRENPQDYGYAAKLGLTPDCEDEVVNQLVELHHRARDYPGHDGVLAEDEQFSAEQNARLARNAERYYRQMYVSDSSSWNLRARHMSETLEALASHLGRLRHPARLVVWEHNSHLGDARATSMADQGEINVGQLAREAHGDDSVLVGFTTYHGTVSAASVWGGPVEHKKVGPADPRSYEALFHQVEEPNLLLNLREDNDAVEALAEPRLERAIGVIYRPETELASHYLRTDLASQFDAVLHFDRTRAVEPLDTSPQWRREDLAETFPTGL
jgi:erythromycin esterase-like protein